MKENKENNESKEEEAILVVLKNFKTQLLPITISLEELVKADSILTIRGTLLQVFLSLKEDN